MDRAKRQKAEDGRPRRLSNNRTEKAIISRSNDTGRNKSIRLTVKAPPSKLRQALHQDDSELDGSDAEAPVRTARSTRNPRKVVEPDSDDSESDDVDEDEEGNDDDEDDDDENNEPSDEDAEGDEEDVDAELLAAEDSEDNDEDTQTPAQVHSPASSAIQLRRAEATKPFKTTSKGAIKIKPAPPVKSVEDREEELEDDDDDDELSDLGSDEEGDGDGDGVDEEDEDEDEDMDDADNGGDETGSRSATPDPSKLTRRQRAVVDETIDDGSLLALSNEAQKKKYLTAEEHASRRMEMARRRKDLSEKKNEEEKMDTINKLLSKPSAKRKTRAEIMAAAAAEAENEDGTVTVDPLFVRWTSTKDGSRIGVPQPWLEGPVGEVLAKGWTAPPVVELIEEVA